MLGFFMEKKTNNSLLSAILDLKKIEAVNRPIQDAHHGVDRTPYQGDRKISYVSYHTRAISIWGSPRPSRGR